MNYTIEKRIFSIYQNPLTASNLIIAHESGNPNNVGKNSLENEVSYMLRNWQNAFVSHWVGGGGKIIQIANAGKVQWGVGPKANGYAYAQVELARTSSRPIFEQDYKAYVWLLQKLALEAGIPCTLNSGASVHDKGIKTHSWVSKNVGGTDHTDPDGYLASWGISQARFRQDIEAGLSALPPLASAPGTFLLHRVVKGDTLWGLSRKYGTTPATLKQLNQLSGNLILIGQQLKVRQY
ncbi:LysM domain-containing protein [Trichococcus flocculiformis]|uniref:LysM peptidoglycan-binding domain-containing protein n=1 Tax=Trichococcus TaxID=82802 RepID=UPI0007A85E4E|nr:MULTISPECIES: LysM peptidoglycan-binding domain-containing protein [Trichococcus]CZQ95562.1 lysin motif [Trichococcus sp. ES5]SHG02491.1 LysM domain-containing protein [Trichococcus flocculiformis]